jgi:hypothetical protein
MRKCPVEVRRHSHNFSFAASFSRNIFTLNIAIFDFEKKLSPLHSSNLLNLLAGESA